jgi:predicted O-methyltransferase YrrM
LLERFWPHFNSLPYKAGEKSGLRYYYPNPFFPLADAAAVSAMMVHFKPKRIIEIGSGFSSAVMLDTNDRFLNNTCQLTFIEPDPVRLYSLLSDEDKKQNKIIPKIIQEVDLGIFNALEAGDILFVDSSHVSKMGSDVNLILFKILPRLKPGTIIHFHDIFFPFEYPEYWVMDFFRGFGWNEAYLIRAYLANNDKYRIIYWNSYLQTFHRSLFEAKFPEYSKDSGGSIWLIRG